MRRIDAAAAWIAAVVCAWAATAQARELTFEQTLALARDRAPTVVAARAAIEEARGRASGAAVLLRDNPIIDGAAGARFKSQDEDSLEARLGLTQVFELGGQRAARMSAAGADLSRTEASAEDALRHALRQVAIAFYQALHASESLRLTRDADTVAANTLHIAERRFAAGDIARLDVGLARAARSRSISNVHDAQAHHEAALGLLRALLGLPANEAIAVQGTLATPPPSAPAPADSRPDLRALEAGVREAEADARLGNAIRWPDLGLGAEYERDENDNLALGRLSLTLPVFDNGQAIRAEALAREKRLRGELDAARRVVAAEVDTAQQVYRSHAAAAEELARHAVPQQDDNEKLAQRAYETGELGLVDLLAVRREVFGTRQDALDRAYDSAVAAVDLQFSAGTLR